MKFDVCFILTIKQRTSFIIYKNSSNNYNSDGDSNGNSDSDSEGDNNNDNSGNSNDDNKSDSIKKTYI